MTEESTERLLLLAFAVTACGDSADRLELILPASPIDEPAVALLVEECPEGVRAWVVTAELGPMLEAVECGASATYYLAYLQGPSERLGLEPGPLALGGCPPEAGITCVETPLPIPSAGNFFTSAVTENGRLSGWNSVPAEWPASIEGLRYPRTTGCRKSASMSFSIPGHMNPKAVSLDRENIALVAQRSANGVNSQGLSVFVFTLPELRSSGPPNAPAVHIDERVFARIASDLQSGELFISVRKDFIYRGRPQDGMRPEYFVESSSPVGRVEQIAVQPAAGSPPSIALVDPGKPGELHVARGGELRSHSAAERMSGTCGRGNRGQLDRLFWLGADELIAMPRHNLHSSDVVPTATTAPDGYWHLAGDELSWRRIPRPDAATDCVRGLAPVPELGLLAVTAAGQFFAGSHLDWKELEFPALPASPVIDVGSPLLVPVGRGFALIRGDGQLVQISGGTVCLDVPAASNNVAELIAHEDSLLALSNGMNGASPTIDLYLVDFLDP